MSNSIFAKIAIVNSTDLTLTLHEKGRWCRNGKDKKHVDCYWNPEPPPVIDPGVKVTFMGKSVEYATSAMGHPDWESGGWATYGSDRGLFKLKWGFPEGPHGFADWVEFPFSAGYVWSYSYDPDTWENHRPEWTTHVWKQGSQA